MDISIPTALKMFSTSGASATAITKWLKKSRGDSRLLISELKEIIYYLDMVIEDHVALEDVIEKIPVQEYKRLTAEGFNFNKLKKAKIKYYSSLQETVLQSWTGKDTESLIISIYEKLIELKIKFPHLADNKNYRWSVRVNNIRKKIWLLIKHIDS